MKRIISSFIVLFFLGWSTPLAATDEPGHTAPVAFTENKGQVSDQQHKPRPDILFSGSDGKLIYHLKQQGISYQLAKSHNSEQTPIPRLDSRHRFAAAEPIVLDIYRLDITWLNCNPAPEIIKGDEIEGYSNYYYEVCPYGALNVKSYKSVTYKDLYQGITLHWTTSEGNLKYEYTVEASADYRQLSWEVKGATGMVVDEQGNLIISTPLGQLVEERPFVVQDGRQLKANWVVKNDRASFQIEGVDPLKPFVIDPLVRLWGTFYGGNDYDGAGYGDTDASNNVFICGQTISPNNIATTGSHQFTYGGSGRGFYPGDAIAVKFNSQGVRQWATYYGGAGADFSNGCAADASGNLYFAGGTNSTNSVVMVTPGCFQPALAGAGNIGDALIVKLSSAGVRLWATYYGDDHDDIALSAAIHPNGDVYVTGATEGGPFTPTAMATPGAHQTQHATTVPGSGDCFIARFSSTGARVWGTYFGAEGHDFGMFCDADLNGNIYVCGETTSTLTSVMASPGCHQLLPGGNLDGFVVKFNAQGSRLWSTYYGGKWDDFAGCCAVDHLNNVYIAGATASPSNIATPGTHKTSLPFGRDAFLVKFNPSGVRLFGTYYGGTGPEDWGSCAIDGDGYAYLVGITASGTTTDIATPCSYQPNYGGGFHDCFLAKIDTTGNRLWGTYYGGAGHECEPSTGYWPGVFVDSNDDVYVAGNVSANSASSVMTSPGAHQTTYGGGSIDAFVAKFDGCRGIVTPAASQLTVCPDRTATLTTVPSCSTQWYLAPTGNNLLSIGSLITQSLSSTTTFYAVDTECGPGLPRTPVTVTVLPGPPISVSADRPKICEGESVTLTASGASSYTWAFSPPSTGTVTVLLPIFSSTYAVSGVGTNGCEGTFVFSVILDPCTGIIEASGHGQSLSIYPNPATGYFIVTGEVEREISILNSLGQTVRVLSLSEENSYKAKVDDLPAGIYFLNSASGRTKHAEKILIR